MYLLISREETVSGFTLTNDVEEITELQDIINDNGIEYIILTNDVKFSKRINVLLKDLDVISEYALDEDLVKNSFDKLLKEYNEKHLTYIVTLSSLTNGSTIKVFHDAGSAEIQVLEQDSEDQSGFILTNDPDMDQGYYPILVLREDELQDIIKKGYLETEKEWECIRRYRASSTPSRFISTVSLTEQILILSLCETIAEASSIDLFSDIKEEALRRINHNLRMYKISKDFQESLVDFLKTLEKVCPVDISYVCNTLLKGQVKPEIKKSPVTTEIFYVEGDIEEKNILKIFKKCLLEDVEIKFRG